MASGSGLAGPVFPRLKIKYHFYKKQVINKNSSVIFALVRLIILSYNKLKSISKGAKLSTTYASIFRYAHNLSVVQKLSNKQSGSVIIRVITLFYN